MPEASWSVAPALNVLLEDANARWPDRRKSTDGTIGDAAHHGGVKEGQKPGGEHVPTDRNGYYRKNGVVRARDIDCRLPDGTEFGDELVQLLIADGKARDRLAYVIFEGTIYSRNNSWRPGRNSGHDHWVHVSLRNETSSSGNTTPDDVDAAAADTAHWFKSTDDVPPFKIGDWTRVTTEAGLRARYTPALNGKIRTTVAKGYRVHVSETKLVAGRWWVRGDTYWFAAEFLELEPKPIPLPQPKPDPAPFKVGDRVVVTASELNGRVKPDGNVRTTVGKGYTFTVQEITKGKDRYWVRGATLYWAADCLQKGS